MAELLLLAVCATLAVCAVVVFCVLLAWNIAREIVTRLGHHTASEPYPVSVARRFAETWSH